MKKTTIYDLPTRAFHWIFAGAFLSAFIISKTVSDDSSVFPYHMLLGVLLAAVAVLRIIWGFIGSRYARFSAFRLNPKDLLVYFGDFFNPRAKRDSGHNPASSWAAIAMIGLALGLGLTGYMMVNGTNKDFYEDLHELFANAFLVIAALHVLGVALHTLRYRDRIAFSMIHGKKEIPDGEGIRSTHPFIALLFISILGLFAFHLGNQYDPTKQTLSLFGKTFQLGEAEVNGDERDDHVGD